MSPLIKSLLNLTSQEVIVVLKEIIDPFSSLLLFTNVSISYYGLTLLTLR